MSIELTKSLLTTEAEEAAKKAVSDRNARKTTGSQMRKYYDDFIIIHNKAKGMSDEDFSQKVLPLIVFSKAKLAYSAGRQAIPLEFKKLIERKVDLISTKQDFDNFMLFYQAVIGYAKYYDQYGEAEGIIETRKQFVDRNRSDNYHKNSYGNGNRYENR